MHLKNHYNEYMAELGELFDKTPKAVFAAIAVSTLTCGGDRLNEAKALIANEWRILHENGIVPQKPCKEARHELAKAEPQESSEGFDGACGAGSVGGYDA